MEREDKINWKIRAATLSVFLLGFIAGALALNAYHVWFSPASSMSKHERFEKVFDQLNLSEPQKADVQKILSDTREEFKNMPPNPEVEIIRNRADEKFKKIFTPEQWQNFYKLREDFREAEKNKSKN